MKNYLIDFNSHLLRWLFCFCLLIVVSMSNAIAAQRIISLAPDLTEIVYAAGAGNKLVAVSSRSDYPPAAKQLPQVASYNHLDIERILTLRPDLVISKPYAATASQLHLLTKQHIPVLLVDIKQLADIAKVMRQIGQAAGTEKQANAAAAKFMRELQHLKQHYQRNQRVKVLYLIWSKPLMTVNRHSVINEVISLCGGDNVFANSLGGAPEINLESVIAANPEVIFYPQSDKKRVLEMFKKWPQITAVQKQQLHEINSNLLNRAGPRVLQGAELMCRALSDCKTLLQS